MMKTNKLGMAISLVVMVSAASLPANPFYVAPPAAGGDDGNNGLSWASPKATPNAAVAAAVNHGDEVIVSNGVYALSAALTISKSITLRSFENDYNTVIFDGGGASRKITIAATATNAIIAGITVSNSVTTSGYGGGMEIQARNAVVSNCLFTSNAGPRGGAIYMRGGTVTDSFFTRNRFTSQQGHAIWIYDAITATRLIRCVFSNTVTSGWSAVDLDRNKGHVTEITGCTFTHNTNGLSLIIGHYSAGATGIVTDTHFIANTNGAVEVRAFGTAFFTNCTFVGNLGSLDTLGVTGAATVYGSSFVNNRATGSSSSASVGGAITAPGSGSRLQVDRCEFRYNYGRRAGGIMLGGTTAETVRNSLFVGNEATFSTGGGAIHADYKSSIENCTIVGNTGGGGAVYFRGQSSSVVDVLNTIVYSNSPANYAFHTAGTYTFDHTCVAPTGTVGYVWGVGNTIGNPLFTDAGTGGYGSDYQMGDLTLQKTSPSKDKGTNLLWMTSGVLDLAGNPRVAFSIVDMGAYEYPQGQSGSMFLFR